MTTVTEKTKFTFRPITASKLDELVTKTQQDYSAADIDIDRDFDVVESDDSGKVTKYKRKPVEQQLQVPEFLQVENVDPLMKSIVMDYVSSFVKAEFIDNFIPVGEHNWETIKSSAATSRGAAKLTIDDDILKLTATHFGKWILQATGSEVLGDRLKAVVDSKASQAAVMRNLGKCDVETVDKIQVRLDAWAESVAESSDSNVDELSEGYDFVTAKLEKLKKSMGTDITQAVEELL